MSKKKRPIPHLKHALCQKCQREDFTLDALCAACFSEGDTDKHIKWYRDLDKATEVQINYSTPK